MENAIKITDVEIIDSLILIGFAPFYLGYKGDNLLIDFLNTAFMAVLDI